ncbi:MAG: hypothetical protein GZ091_06750 [Paludibacter sp.]|nr:hypothetical protein [Paludibacter sp.]
MRKSVNIVLIGALTIVSLLLALPFTPLRDSFSGITTKHIENAATKMGVDFNSQIKNARKVTNSRSYDIAGIDINKNTTAKKGNNPTNNYIGSNKLQNSGSYITGTANEKEITSGYTIGGNFGTYSANSKKTTKTILDAFSPGFKSTTTDLTGTGTGISKPKAGQTYSPNEGGTHPGVDPTNPPLASLPIGDGLNSLLILAAIFAAFKIKNSLSI